MTTIDYRTSRRMQTAMHTVPLRGWLTGVQCFYFRYKSKPRQEQMLRTGCYVPAAIQLYYVQVKIVASLMYVVLPLYKLCHTDCILITLGVSLISLHQLLTLSTLHITGPYGTCYLGAQLNPLRDIKCQNTLTEHTVQLRSKVTFERIRNAFETRLRLVRDACKTRSRRVQGASGTNAIPQDKAARRI